MQHTHVNPKTTEPRPSTGDSFGPKASFRLQSGAIKARWCTAVVTHTYILHVLQLPLRSGYQVHYFQVERGTFLRLYQGYYHAVLLPYESQHIPAYS